MQELTDGELVRRTRDNNTALLSLLACPMPTADGASLGYEGEFRQLMVEGDELLEEVDRRGLGRKEALFGVMRRVECSC